MTTYSGTVTDGPITGDIASPVTHYSVGLTDGPKVGQSFFFGFRYQLTDGVVIGSTLTRIVNWGAVISELIKLHDTSSVKGIYKLTLSDLARMRDALNITQPVALLSAVTVHDTFGFALGVVINDTAYITDIANPMLTYGITYEEAMTMYDVLGWFASLSLVDGVTITDDLASKYFAIVNMVQDFLLGSSLTQKMVFNVTTAETLNLTDSQVLQMIYAGVLSEDICLSAIYVSPTTGNITTWAINTRTNAITEYQNWAFNSFAQMGRKYLGADENGLYELNGERDLTENIVSDIISGYTQFNASYLAGLKGVYIGMRGQDEFFLNLDAGDGRVYNYQFVANAGPALMTTKVNIGKGLRSRYFAFELISTGPDFDLDTVEFVPMISKRRV